MSALSVHFNKKLNQASRVVEDRFRKVEVDSEGNEHVSFPTFDYPTFQFSNGRVEDWSLKNLLKAGISPAFPIHTTFGTRLEAEQYLESLSSQINELFPSTESKSVSESESSSEN